MNEGQNEPRIANRARDIERSSTSSRFENLLPWPERRYGEAADSGYRADCHLACGKSPTAAHASYMCAEEFGHLHCERAHPSRRAVDQDFLPRPNPSLVAKTL